MAWSWPAEILLGSLGGGGGDSDDSPTKDGEVAPSKPGAIPSWFKRVKNRKYHVHDLGPIEGEAAPPSRMELYDYQKAVTVLRKEFGETSKSYGSGQGVTKAPLAQVPAEWRFKR